jgi:SAM-dependent methyltransferase
MKENYGIRPDYRSNPRASVSDTGTFWASVPAGHARYYQRAVYRRAGELTRETGAESLLDVGCGLGVKLQALHQRHPRLKIVGLDTAEAVRHCRAHWDFGEWHEVDLESPPRDPSWRAEVVVCADVIEHIENPDPLVAFLKQAVLPGGRLILSTLDRLACRSPGALSPPNPAHIREWSFDEFGGYLRSRGLCILDHYRTWPVSFGLHRLCWEENIKPFLKGLSGRSCQVCIAGIS